MSLKGTSSISRYGHSCMYERSLGTKQDWRQLAVMVLWVVLKGKIDYHTQTLSLAPATLSNNFFFSIVEQ